MVNFQKARQAARSIRQSEGLRDDEPFPIDAYLRKQRVLVEVAPLDPGIAGLSTIVNGRAGIVVRAGDSERRHRFTKAHELGHLVLHAVRDVHLNNGKITYYRSDRNLKGPAAAEIEANQFAAALLMPAEGIMAFLGGPDETNGYTEEQIALLAERYEVSPQAMAIRLSSLMG